MIGLPRSAAALFLLLAPAGAAAAEAPDPAEGLEALRAADQRVAAIGFRLVTTNLAACPRHGPATGLVLHDLSQYRPGLRSLARHLFALGPGLGIASVVPGSPAEAAGLGAGDRILAANGRSLVGPEDAGGGTARASNSPFAAKLALLDAALAEGAVRLEVERGGERREVALRPVAGCASRFQLVPASERNAWSDGEQVSLTTALLDFAADEDELATILGHELAHNILGHRARLKAEGVPAGLLRAFGDNHRKVLATEIEADRLGLALMDRAGFRLAGAESFWRRLAAATAPAILSGHPGFRARLATIRDAAAALARRRADGEAGPGR